MPGFKEKKRTRAKKMAEKTRSAVLSEIWLPRTGWIPVVKEVVAHLGIAKHGPMVRKSNCNVCLLWKQVPAARQNVYFQWLQPQEWEFLQLQ